MSSHSILRNFFTKKSRSRRDAKMSTYHNILTIQQYNHRYRKNNILWSIIFFSIGFYIRGIFDSYSVIVCQENHKELNENLDISKNSQTQSPKNVKYYSNSSIGKDKDRTHWCVIANKFLPRTTRGHFSHFPHTSEIILPCWSYFVKEGVTERCGIAIANRNFRLPPWIKELVDTMGCQILQNDHGLPSNNIADFIPVDDVQYIPNYYLMRPRLDYFRYLDHPEHAHMLRRLFVDDEYIATVKGHGKPYQIGIIQREGARRFDNINELHETLIQSIPEGNITVTDFKFKTVKEQATWFATKDVVIASHGAALTNSIFITPGTIVMQLYPPGYFLQTLEPLIEQSGGIAIQWYEKGVNPYIKTHEINQRNHTEFERLGQHGGFSPPPKEVSDRVRAALGLTQAGVSIMRGMFGVDV